MVELLAAANRLRAHRSTPLVHTRVAPGRSPAAGGRPSTPPPASGRKACDLCGGQSFEQIASRDRHGRDLATGICVHCGLVAHLEIPSDEELAEFYARQYRQQYHGEETPSARRLVRAWKNGQRIIDQLSPYVSPGDRVFEVGAGIGCTVKGFEQHGCRASGVEPHEGFREFSCRELRADLAAGDLDRLPAMAPQDLVLLVHVIEHLASPTRALNRIRELLKPGGRLYVECPNLAAPFARRSQLFHFAHIHNFTPATLSMLAEKCGFAVERRFSSDDDPNLQMLLTRIDSVRLNVDRDSYAATLRALSRYNNLTYHLRASYLRSRLRKIGSYAAEHLFARRQARQIRTSCQSPTSRA